jgi:hypothetical protein
MCPLRWSGFTAGTRFSFAQDYTHPARTALFEIFIPSIRFSDSHPPRFPESAPARKQP